PGRGDCLFFAAYPVRRTASGSPGRGLSGTVWHPGAGTAGCALGDGVHGSGRPGGGAGLGARTAAPDAG
ncbi:hypothetical protein RFX61_18190, partial [Acinetobacter baumannii]|nr:hypothetical protein [Acinetobacter baumannii]